MSIKDLIERHGKGMSGCESVEEWACRHLRSCNGHRGNRLIKNKLLEANKAEIESYRSAFDKVKKDQEAAKNRKEALQAEVDSAVTEAQKKFG